MIIKYALGAVYRKHVFAGEFKPGHIVIAKAVTHGIFKSTHTEHIVPHCKPPVVGTLLVSAHGSKKAECAS